MKIDSVFAVPAIPSSDDRPLIPVDAITEAMDAVEEPAIALMTRTLNEQTDALLDRADEALARGDEDAIRLLNWGARADIERAIASVWSEGWKVGQGQALEEMRLSVPKKLREESRFAMFATDSGLLQAIARLLTLGIVDLRQSAAVAAVQERVFRLAGDFSDDTLNRLKGHLQAAIAPQPDTGQPIDRPELLRRIQSTLNVSKNRAQNIARTETTNTYNDARLEGFSRSPLATHLRFLSIDDTRRSDICTSRAGMVVPITDRETIARNTPALHYLCRSVWSVLMGRINPAHQAMIDDESRRPENRVLAPLMPGWNGAEPTALPARSPSPVPQPVAPAGVPIPTREEAERRLKQVGEGAYGTVYRDNAIAYKYGEIDDLEIEIASEMGDLGIGPRVLGESDEGYAMDYLDGYGTLYETLKRPDFADLPTATAINRNTIEAYRRMHAADIAHNDLHSANIMINVATGDAKIIDYGFATGANGTLIYADARNLTRSIQFTGTVDGAKFKAAAKKLEKTASDLWQVEESPTYQADLKAAVNQFYDDVLALDLSPKSKRKKVQAGQPAIARNNPGPRPEPQRIAAAANPLVRRGRELAPELDDIDTRIGRAVRLYDDAETLEDKERYAQRGAERMQQIRNRMLERSQTSAEAAKEIVRGIEIKGFSKADRARLEESLEEIFRLTGGKGARSLQTVQATGNVFRAFADDGVIDMGARKYPGDRFGTLLHEVGHHVEFEDSQVYRNAANWVRGVADGPVAPLNAIAQTAQYSDDELAYPDHFINPYVGKLAGDGATEAVSVGLEHFVDGRSMFELYRKDPDHFYMMLGILL